MSGERLDTLYVRAFTEKPGHLPIGARPDRKRLNEPSARVLVIDCETSADEIQRLWFGWCQQWDGDALLGEGLFYDPDYVTGDELEMLAAAAEEAGASLITVAELRQSVILDWAFEGNATIVGFNLAFDIARTALHSSPARGHMRGGFTHRLADDDYAACIRSKHLSSTMTLFDFAQPRKNATPGSIRDAWDPEKADAEDVFIPANRGYFVDVKTLAAAQISGKHSLESLAKFLKTTPKMDVEHHGRPLKPEYIRYARTDVQVTLECYQRLMAMYAQHQLTSPAHKIFSEASIGKAYLEEMGVEPFFWFQNHEPRQNLGRNMSSYYGGRAESGIRRKVTQVMYCDFKSMYPTVNGLMGSTRFVTAQGYTEEDTTEATQAFLDAITVEDLLKPETWRRLPTIVQLKPDDDLLPARMRYTPDRKDRKKKDNNFTIGLNPISSDLSLWYMLPDVVQSKVLTGRAPRIERAITFIPGPQQEDLKSIRLFGREEYTIDPREDDIFIRLIDMRDEAKAKRDPLEKVMKIIANATCYGIYAEVQRDEAPKPEPIDVYGPHGEGGTMQSQAIEEPGEFFHPVLAPLITSAARLMLALAERLARDEGLAWVFCDTDSIAMARPNGISDADFYARCHRVIELFNTLNPYRQAGSILKAEDQNFEPNTKPKEGKLWPLYCLSISAKRYALFNIDGEGRPVIRKFSAHGLGHFMEPYSHEHPAPRVPDPIVADAIEGPDPARDARELGGKRWQYDFWYHVIMAALVGKPNQVRRDFHDALKQPAMLRYGATSPAMLRWMKAFNAGKFYAEQVKPYGFMVGFLHRAGGAFAEDWHAELIEEVRVGPPTKEKRVRPVAPFDRDPAKAVAKAFDRDTGRAIDPSELRTYAEALALYHVSAEEKFENGRPADTGPTVRRHLHITQIGLIGKEANQVGEAGEEDGESEAVVEFEP